MAHVINRNRTTYNIADPIKRSVWHSAQVRVRVASLWPPLCRRRLAHIVAICAPVSASDISIKTSLGFVVADADGHSHTLGGPPYTVIIIISSSKSTAPM